MPKEIERKFLTLNEKWRGLSVGTPYKQGYLTLGPPTSIRVRIEGEQARLNIKEAILDIERTEFEYSIPMADANELLDKHSIGGIIEKTRYKIHDQGLIWEVDEFHGDNAGLVVVEVELEHRDQQINPPNWVGKEVSGNPLYLNVNLCQYPYKMWT
jgi:CYTH domain-containing protein